MKIKLAKGLPLFAAGEALVASGLFLMQRGFWGGHGKLDLAIWALALPSSALALTGVSIPVPEFLQRNDFLLIIWFPAIVNCVLFFFLGLLLDRILEKRNSPVA